MEERGTKVQGRNHRRVKRKALAAVHCLFASASILSVISVTLTIMAAIHIDPTPVTLWHEIDGTKQMACYLICVW